MVNSKNLIETLFFATIMYTHLVTIYKISYEIGSLFNHNEIKSDPCPVALR